MRKSKSHSPDQRPTVLKAKNGIIWGTGGSSSAIVLADIDLFFHRQTNFVSVKPSYNFFLRR